MPALGDPNGSGSADNTDGVIIFNVFLGNIPNTFPDELMDANRDGMIDNVDAVILMNWFLGNIPYLPYP